MLVHSVIEEFSWDTEGMPFLHDVRGLSCKGFYSQRWLGRLNSKIIWRPIHCHVCIWAVMTPELGSVGLK